MPPWGEPPGRARLSSAFATQSIKRGDPRCRSMRSLLLEGHVQEARASSKGWRADVEEYYSLDHVGRKHPRREVDTANYGESVLDAARRMRDRQVGALIVVDDMTPVGVLTDRGLTVRCWRPGSIRRPHA